jgi:hypothetical protein
MNERKERGDAKGATRTRRHRARPIPKWLLQKEELDQIAQRRTLMILSVLSGEKPVTNAIGEANISRGHYYQLEEKALEAILQAMEPGASPGRPPDTTSRLLQMESKIGELEAAKRRLERLLQMTRKVLKPGPMKSARGRPPSKRDGKSGSPSSRGKSLVKTASVSPTPSSEASTR